MPTFLLESRLPCLLFQVNRVPAINELKGLSHEMDLAFDDMTNTPPTTLSARKTASQSAFINEQLYSTCD
jgi:hypothetical protein